MKIEHPHKKAVRKKKKGNFVDHGFHSYGRLSHVDERSLNIISWVNEQPVIQSAAWELLLSRPCGDTAESISNTNESDVTLHAVL